MFENPIELAGAGVAILIVGFLLGRLLRKREGDSLFARIFKDNKDFDSTLDRLSISAIILLMLILFHDDMADPAKGGLIINVFVLAFNAWQTLVLGKAVMKVSQQKGEMK